MATIIISDFQSIEEKTFLFDLNLEQIEKILITGIQEYLFNSRNNKIFIVDFAKVGIYLVNKEEQIVFMR